MNSVVMSIRGLPSLELWVPTLPVVPVSSGRNQMVPGGSGGSGGSGDSEIVGFDWSYQSRIWKWYFVTAHKNTIPMMRPTNTNGPKVEDMQHYSGSGKRLGGI